MNQGGHGTTFPLPQLGSCSTQRSAAEQPPDSAFASRHRRRTASRSEPSAPMAAHPTLPLRRRGRRCRVAKAARGHLFHRRLGSGCGRHRRHVGGRRQAQTRGGGSARTHKVARPARTLSGRPLETEPRLVRGVPLSSDTRVDALLQFGGASHLHPAQSAVTDTHVHLRIRRQQSHAIRKLSSAVDVVSWALKGRDASGCARSKRKKKGPNLLRTMCTQASQSEKDRRQTHLVMSSP